MGLFGSANYLVLLISYITYLCCGLLSLISGLIYIGGTGTMGDTGIMMVILGLFFIIVGYVAIVGLRKKSGIILFVVECIMIVLYFVLFIVIIAAIMLGTGARDPVQRMFDDNWAKIKVQVYEPAPLVYEQQCTNGAMGSNPACISYTGNFKSQACISNTEKGRPDSIGLYGINCTKFDDRPHSSCSALKTQCLSCESQCKAMLVAHSKEKNVAACVISGLLVVFMVGVVALHTFARAGFYKGGGEGLCCKEMGINGWIIVLVNIAFSALGLTTMILGAATVRVPLDSKFDDFATTGPLWVFMLLIGLALWLIPVFQIILIATHKAPNYIADIVVTVLIFIMMLVTVFLGFLSGALVDDINSLYDNNYAKYRGELELFDNDYCQIPQADCTLLIEDPSKTVYPVCGDTCQQKPSGYNGAAINAADLWSNQHSALQQIPFENLPPSNFLHSCKSSELCIRCGPAVDALAQMPTDKAFKFNALTIRGHSGAANRTLDEKGDNVERWTELLYNATESNRTAKFALKKCEIALNAMSGSGRNSPWDKFPNPAKSCKNIHFAIRYSFQEEIKDEFTGEVLKKKDESKAKPEVYANTQNCSEYLLSMMQSTSNQFGCSTQLANTCKSNIKSNFELVYHYMIDSGVPYCQMPDAACKDKIAYEIAEQMTNCGIIGSFILIFQLAVIFTTYWGIQDFGLLCLGGSSGGGSDDAAEEEEEEEEADDGDDSNE